MSTSNRLSKLSQYLIDGNYQQAIQLHSRQIQSPSTQLQHLLLAKAYFISQDYQKVIQILNHIQKSQNIRIRFQAKLLKIKANYLEQNENQKDLRQLQIFQHQHKNILNDYHKWCLNQIKYILQKRILVKKSNFISKQILNDEFTQFQKIYRQFDDYSSIMQGMPVYLISKRWFDHWQQYVSLQSKVKTQNPGPMTNFQIIDHIFNGFYDSRKPKLYTNNYLFESCKYIILPKKCWQFLYKKYGGTQIIRYNISSPSNQVYTQTNLKRISIIHKDQLNNQVNGLTQRDLVTSVQITKKQNWKGLIQSKLESYWGTNGFIFELYENQKRSVDLNQFLQDCDTVGKIYLYVPNEKNNYVSTNTNSNSKQTLSSVNKCANKSCNNISGLKFCQCKTIKYCCIDCLKQDRDNHRKKCDLQLQYIKQKSAVLESFHLPEKQYSGRKGIVGLRNLGNTCYMNSGLQCMSNTKQITDYFMSNAFMKEINTSNPLGTKGNLACAYAQLIRQIWTGKDEIISPFNLKKMIGKFATQFNGYGQQDSQQFISYLIDGLQEDLNLVKKKQTFETKDEILPDQIASQQSQRNYAKRIKSYIRDLMAGQFKSTVKCLNCQKISICFDPYLLLSLPIPLPKQSCCYLITRDLSIGAIKLTFQYTDKTTIKQLEYEIRKEYPKIQILVFVKVDMDKFEIQKIIQNTQQTIKSNKVNNQEVFAYEIPSVPQDSSLYFAQYFYKEERCSFGRFLIFPNRLQKSDFQAIVENSYKRISNRSYEQVIQSKKQKQPTNLYNKICNRYLAFDLRRNIKMLTFKQNKQFSFSKKSDKRISLYDCLSSFSNPQILQKDNQWYCNRCKQFKPAQKQLQIYKSNKIMVLAFKRFSRFKKIKEVIDFSIQGFNMGPYLKNNKQKKPIIYDLYGVVNHYGSLGGGHYTAYCQNFLNKKWYQFNDSRVSQISKRDIVSDSSYVLFFRRRD